MKAIQFVAERLVRSRIHFDDSAEMDLLERWGSCKECRDHPGFMWCVFSSVLDRALADANFDRQKTLRRMAAEDVLLTGSGRGFTRQKRFASGSRVYRVCIDNERLEALLEVPPTDEPGGLASCGVVPC